MVAVVGAYQPGCRRVCAWFPACCGVRGISLPLAKTGVSGSEQEVCIPVPLDATAFVVVPPLAPPLAPSLPPPLIPPLEPATFEEQPSAEGECFFAKGRRLDDGPGKSVGKVLLSTGT